MMNFRVQDYTNHLQGKHKNASRAWKYLAAEQGSSLLTAIILVFCMLTLAVILTSRVIYNAKDKQSYLAEIQAGYVAESGIAAAVWYLDTIDGNWLGDAPQEHILQVDDDIIGSYTVTVSHGAKDKVTCTGYVPNRDNFKAKRIVVLIRDGGNKRLIF